MSNRASRALSVVFASTLVLAPGPLGAQSTPPDQAILLQQKRLQRNPYDAASYHRLGDAYIQKARETGDMTYFDLAERALEKSMAIAPGNAGAVRHLAFVHSSRHAFEQAVTRAARALELGKYDEAEAAYTRMMKAKRDLASYSRRSGLKNLRGDADGSMADLRRAI